MNVLVTGGAGYIGSVTAATLLERGHRVVVLDNLSTGHLAAVPEAAVFAHGDIADDSLVGALLERHNIDAVMHFSANSLVAESMARPLEYFENNTAKTLALLRTMTARGVWRFIFSSTAAVYGTPDSLPISEDAPIRPSSVYGESKHLVERMLPWLAATSGLGSVSLRYFNAAGATEKLGEDHDPETHLIPLALQVAMGLRQRIGIFGDDYDTSDGTAIRDYIHVADLADAHILALEDVNEGDARSYNLGNGRGFSVREVLAVCRQVTGHPIPAEALPRREGDPPALVAHSVKIASELGWRPRYEDLEAIVASAWRWHQANRNGYPSTPGAKTYT